MVASPVLCFEATPVATCRWEKGAPVNGNGAGEGDLPISQRAFSRPKLGTPLPVAAGVHNNRQLGRTVRERSRKDVRQGRDRSNWHVSKLLQPQRLGENWSAHQIGPMTFLHEVPARRIVRRPCWHRVGRRTNGLRDVYYFRDSNGVIRRKATRRLPRSADCVSNLRYCSP